MSRSAEKLYSPNLLPLGVEGPVYQFFPYELHDMFRYAERTHLCRPHLGWWGRAKSQIYFCWELHDMSKSNLKINLCQPSYPYTEEALQSPYTVGASWSPYIGVLWKATSLFFKIPGNFLNPLWRRGFTKSLYKEDFTKMLYQWSLGASRNSDINRAL